MCEFQEACCNVTRVEDGYSAVCRLMGFVEGKWACCIPVCLSHGNPVSETLDIY
jgi:hypothetical protein